MQAALLTVVHLNHDHTIREFGIRHMRDRANIQIKVLFAELVNID